MPPFIEYAAKFVCGPFRGDDDVVAGTYATSINIHNPQPHNQKFCKKFVFVPQEGTCPLSGPPRPSCPRPVVIEDELGPDLAERVDCPLIQVRLRPNAPDHVEGFVVLEVQTPPSDVGPQPVLDVVGKYTARAFGSPDIGDAPGEVSTLDVVDYPAQRILRNQ